MAHRVEGDRVMESLQDPHHLGGGKRRAGLLQHKGHALELAIQWLGQRARPQANQPGDPAAGKRRSAPAQLVRAQSEPLHRLFAARSLHGAAAQGFIAHAGRVKKRVRDLLLEVFVAGQNRAQEVRSEHGHGASLGRALFQEIYHRRPPVGRALFHHFSPFGSSSAGEIQININKLGESGESRGAELKQYQTYRPKARGRKSHGRREDI
jgi:hypothetical protein